MKAKRLLILMLALVMCLSVFVSCNKDKNKDESNNNNNNNESNNVSAEKDAETVTNAIGKLNLKELINSTLDEIFAQGTQSDLNELFAELKKLNGELTVTTTVDGEKRSVYLGMKDEIVKITDPFGETSYAFLAGSSFILLSPENNGYGLEVSDEIPVMMPDVSESVDLDQYKQMVDMYLTDDVMKALEGFKLDVTKADLVEKDGFYILTNDALIRIANEVLDTAIDVMKALEAPDEAIPPVDETKAQIKGIVEALNLQVGFSVKNDKVVGIKFATEFDPNAIGAIFGGGAKDEAMPAAETSPKVAVSFVAMSNDDATLLESVEFSYSVANGDNKQAYSVKSNFLYNDKAVLCGADVSFTIEMDGGYLGGYYDDTKNYEYNVRGSQKYTGTVKLDLSKLSTAGATVADVNVTMSAKANKYTKEYSDTTSGRWVVENITDAATIKTIEEKADYLKNGSISANAKVEKTGVLAFSFTQKEDSVATTSFSGTFTWTGAPNFGTVPEDIRKNYIENEALASHIERIEEFADNLHKTHPDVIRTAVKDFGNGATITWQDAESGLWARVYCYDVSDVSIFTVQPESDVVLNTNNQ